MFLCPLIKKNTELQKISLYEFIRDILETPIKGQYMVSWVTDNCVSSFTETQYALWWYFHSGQQEPDILKHLHAFQFMCRILEPDLYGGLGVSDTANYGVSGWILLSQEVFMFGILLQTYEHPICFLLLLTTTASHFSNSSWLPYLRWSYAKGMYNGSNELTLQDCVVSDFYHCT